MVVRGAPAIGCTAAYGVALEARATRGAARAIRRRAPRSFQVLAQPPHRGQSVLGARRMRQRHAQTRSDSTQAAAAALLELARQIHSDDIEINRAIGRHGAPLIADGARVMTHCNAGALATAGHGTLGVVRSARDRQTHQRDRQRNPAVSAGRGSPPGNGAGTFP